MLAYVCFSETEVVGLSPALKMGFELLRPWGCISSVGVHNGEADPPFLPRNEASF